MVSYNSKLLMVCSLYLNVDYYFAVDFHKVLLKYY
jgi:hypothetical protein